ncbi:hypothetical protein GCM10023213_23440 [Prosthecobacter algae]|uniref:Uncharacterized protein n=1 Tax=Prosthecobacter algae TaxID=1144682 RepID=A0ABP9PAP7_9BACT
MFVRFVGKDFWEYPGACEGGFSAAAGSREEQEGAALCGFFLKGVASFKNFFFSSEENVGMLGLEGIETKEGRALFFDVPDDLVHIASKFV